MKKLNIMLEDELLPPRSDPVPRGRQKQFPISWGRLLAFGLMALLPHHAAWANIIEQPQFQLISVPELGETSQIQFTVINQNDTAMILDYAMYAFKNIGGDSADNTINQMWNTWHLTIAPSGQPGDQQTWVIDFSVNPQDPPGTTLDTGRNSVLFATEWSPLVGTPSEVLNGAGQPVGVITDDDNALTPTTNYVNGVAGLFNGIVPSSPIDEGGQQSSVTAEIDVYDVPDNSSTLGLLGIAAVSLLACDWRRLKEKAYGKLRLPQQ
jgi:hypothetical protein